MGRGKPLAETEIGKIIALKEENYSNRDIARRIGRDPWTINNFVKNKENYGKHRRGRTSKATTERERRSILREASNSAATARKIKEKVGTTASVHTVRRVIKQCPHLRRQKLQKKPRLLQHHKNARLELCREHLHWKTEWQQVIFSDEKKFNLDGPDGFRHYFHDLRKSELFLSRRHTSVGSVMVWAAISFHGPINLVVLEGRQTSADYIGLLEIEKIFFNEMFEHQPFVFQQDNAGIHTAKRVKTWFSDNNMNVLNWPPLSPDLNLIENVWGWLSRKMYEEGRQYDTKLELIEAIEAAFEEIPENYLHSLYNSLHNRLFDVIHNNGGSTKY